MKAKRQKPLSWQLDPELIDTPKVQLWHHGSMLTAMLSAEDAKAAVTNGSCFVISGQAIGRLTDDGYYAG